MKIFVEDVSLDEKLSIKFESYPDLNPDSQRIRLRESPPDRMLALPWRRLFLAAFGLNLVVVAVLRDRLLWGWAFCLNYNKRGLCYYVMCVFSRARTATTKAAKPAIVSAGPGKSLHATPSHKLTCHYITADMSGVCNGRYACHAMKPAVMRLHP